MNQRTLAFIAALLVVYGSAPACIAAGSSEIWVTPSVLVPGGQATVHYKGRYADKANLTIHYGFNGWNRVDNIDGLQVEDDGGNQNYYKQAPMAKPSDTEFRVLIHIPAAARALHFVFFWNDNGTKRWDNNEGKDYAAAVTVPYIGRT